MPASSMTVAEIAYVLEIVDDMKLMAVQTGSVSSKGLLEYQVTGGACIPSLGCLLPLDKLPVYQVSSLLQARVPILSLASARGALR